MKVSYYPETDTLYIDLSGQSSEESEEVAPGVVLDFGAGDVVVGIEIEGASRCVDLSALESVSVPVKARRKAVVTAVKDGTATYRATSVSRSRRTK